VPRHLALLAICLLIVAIGTGRASAQYMFLDTDGDGNVTEKDVVNLSDVNKVDIWVVTDHKRDGSTVTVASDQRPLSIFSYEFVIAAEGGTVSWGEYTNKQPTMDVSFGRFQNDREVYLGYGGPVALAPGRYKLGTLEVRVKSGSPTLSFRSQSELYAGGRTSFGSKNAGKDGDNTLKFANGRDQGGSGASGDWYDADGISRVAATSQVQAAIIQAAPAFGVRVTRGDGLMRLRVTTTIVGHLRVRLYDVQGRLVRTLVMDEKASVGVHEFSLGAGNQDGRRLASGVYLYRVEASEGAEAGRVVILR